MATKAENKLQQANFLAGYLAHGDAPKAYVEAGYEGDPKIGSDQILRRPSVQAWLAETGDAVAQAAIAKVAEQTVDVLQTRDGLSQWLVDVVRGDETEDMVTQDGEIVAKAASMKDRLAAAKLLASIQGFLVQKVEVKSESEVFVFHTMDNGRALEIPGEIVVDPEPSV